MPDHARINNTMGKMAYYLGNHNSICVSVSGGSDSDIIVHMIATYFREHLPKIHFVFVNTGLEYRATLRHIDELEQKYGIKIDRIRGTPIPISVKKNGVPFISKRVSDYMSRLSEHRFDWSDVTVGEGVEKFGKVKASLRWWCDDWGKGSMFNISRNKGLKEFLQSEKPSIKFSAECCHVSKKKPLSEYQKSVNADMVINGVRKSEGGSRAGAYSSCFREGKGSRDFYMPLFFWDNDTKQYYKESEGIRYSDCYEVWGMKRTGCVGCPYGQKLEHELEMMKEYEPNLYKACQSVFGESYALTRKYKDFQKKIDR